MILQRLQFPAVKDRLWQHVLKGNPVSLDTETTGLRLEQGDTIRGFSFSFGTEAWYVPLSHPDSDNLGMGMADILLRIIQQAETVVFWNSAFDRTVVRLSFGIEFEDDKVWDGMTVDWLMNESADHRLKYVGARVFGTEAKKEKEDLDALFRGTSAGEFYRQLRHAHLLEAGVPRLPAGVGAVLHAQARELAADSKKTWATLTAEDIGGYAAQDARLTLDLHTYQMDWLADNPEYQPALDREFLVEGLAYRMRETGIKINQDRARDHLEAALNSAEGLASLFPGVNLKSAKQVQALVYDIWQLPCSRRTKAGARSTDKIALAGLSYDPRVQALMEFRKLTKAIDAFYVPMLNKQSEDGRIHPSFNAHRTVTGRWSCSGPNLQQVPKAAEQRDIFEPAPGMVFVSADLPAAELRVAAILAEEDLWLEAFRRGEDLHQVMADAAGVSRSVAKTMNFSCLYGVGSKKLANTLSEGTGTPPDVQAAAKALRAFWKAIPRVKRMMNGLGEYWVRNGRIPIRPWDGRFRHRFNMRTKFPEPEYKALNSVIQGSIAEAVKDWMLALEPKVTAIGGRIVAQVHDSVVLEVPMGRPMAARDILQQTWDQVNPFKELPWPLSMEDKF